MLTTKQKRFCDEYLVDFNATQAALRSGYSADSAKEIGCQNLTKLNIKQYIDKRLEDLSMGAAEATKMISDIAKGSLNDYFTIKMVEHTPRVEKSLKELIKQIEFEIEFERQVAELAKLGKEEKKIYDEEQKQRRMQIFRYQVELKHNPKATRIVDGKTVFIQAAELDMVKLVKDKERGRIKSLSYTPNGPRVEMYSADAAIINVLKLNGKFKEEDEKKPPLTININGKSVKIGNS